MAGLSYAEVPTNMPGSWSAKVMMGRSCPLAAMAR